MQLFFLLLIALLVISFSHAFGGMISHATSSRGPRQHHGVLQRIARKRRIGRCSMELGDGDQPPKSSESSSEDIVVQLPLLEAELTNLRQQNEPSSVKQEQLEDEIQHAKSAAEFGVRRAQLQFYEAFSTFSVEAMRNVWCDDDDAQTVRCIHPGMPCIDGKEAIMTSWEMMLRTSEGDNDKNFVIEPSRVAIDICGQTAMCSCVETTSPNGGTMEALNVYRRIDGEWKMTLHMASPILINPATAA